MSVFRDEGYGYDVFGLHPEHLLHAAELCAPIYERYFRVDSRGAEHVPPDGPVVLVANHAGVLPVDGGILGLDILRKTPRIPRMVADHFVPRLPIVSTLFARCGVVSGTRANVQRLLENGELTVIFPEGTSGPAKPFHERYHLQQWRVGFAELAIRHNAAIVPVAIIGAEESWPLGAKLPFRAFGSPYVPVPLVPIPLPAHYHIRYGAPLRFAHANADDPNDVSYAASTVWQALARLIENGRIERRGVFR